MMNQNIKASWVARLRSMSEEQHCRLTVKNRNQFCVIGVLWDLFAQATGTPWHGDELVVKDGSSAADVVNRWAGIEKTTIYVRLPELGLYKLWACNDDLRMTFSELADLIEAQL